MANRVRKTEHNGAKHAKGFWGTKKEAKTGAKKRRRQNDKIATKEGTRD